MTRLRKTPRRAVSGRRSSAVLATFFGVGRLRPAPGSWGSLAALPPGWLLLQYTGVFGLAAAAAVLFLLGCVAADRHARALGKGDPGEIVIDEVVGQWLTLLCAPPELFWFAAAFLLFRLADIVKPWPVNLIDARMSGGIAVMLDDAAAAVYAGGAVLAAQAAADYITGVAGWG